MADVAPYNTAHTFTSLVMNSPVYLRHLLARARRLGVKCRHGSIRSLEDAEEQFKYAEVGHMHALIHVLLT